jgi:hypothetical protein
MKVKDIFRDEHIELILCNLGYRNYGYRWIWLGIGIGVVITFIFIWIF